MGLERLMGEEADLISPWGTWLSLTLQMGTQETLDLSRVPSKRLISLLTTFNVLASQGRC